MTLTGRIVLLLVLAGALPAAAAPDAITFTISHADCGPTYHAGDNRDHHRPGRAGAVRPQHLQ
jgi:hypothetical protein